MGLALPCMVPYFSPALVLLQTSFLLAFPSFPRLAAGVQMETVCCSRF